MRPRLELAIWAGINLVLALSVPLAHLLLTGHSLDWLTGVVLSTGVLCLNLFRLWRAAALRLLYAITIIANHAALFVSGDFSFAASLMNATGLTARLVS